MNYTSSQMKKIADTKNINKKYQQDVMDVIRHEAESGQYMVNITQIFGTNDEKRHSSYVSSHVDIFQTIGYQIETTNKKEIIIRW